MRDFKYPKIEAIEETRRPAGAWPEPGPGWKRGLTLIELLVASLIMVVVTGAAFTLFRVTATHEQHQQELMTQTQNLRAALYAVSRDARMAGSGLPLIGATAVQIYVDKDLINPDFQDGGSGWFTYAGETTPGVRAIYGTNIEANAQGSDSLTIFRTEVESPYPIGRLSGDFTPGSGGSLALQEAVIVGESFSSGDMLAIADGLQAVVVQGTTSASEGASVSSLELGPRFNPTDNMSSTYRFPAGSQVYNLRDVTFVTYYVDTDNNRLMADYHDVTLVDEDADDPDRPHLVTLADNIEDFQVAYYFRNPANEDLTLDANINLDRLDKDGDVVRAVQMALVSRSSKRSKVQDTGDPVEVMGHTAPGEDGFTRRVLSEVIRLRNY